MLYPRHAGSEDTMSSSQEVSDNESKLMVSFAIGKNRTVFVRGQYDATKATPVERLEFLGIIQQFGQELSVELLMNFKAALMKVVLCEVDPGSIVFELETDQPAGIRRKAIMAVQAAFDDSAAEALVDVKPKPTEPEQMRVQIPPNTWPMMGPRTLQ